MLQTFLLTLALLAPPVQDTTPLDAATVAALDQANARFSAAWVAGDVESVLAAYTASPVLHPPAGGVLTSPERVRGIWAGITRLQRAGHRLEPTLRRRLGPGRVLEMGRWHSSVRGEDGTAPWLSGCYTVVWEQGDDRQWRMAYDGWTAPNDASWACRPS